MKVELSDAHLTFWFDAWHYPVWGDLSIKGGRSDYAHNTGFTSPDWDPTAPPSSGSGPPGPDGLHHLLVPNGVINGEVPEPLTMAGVFLGISALAGYIRKRRMA